MALTSWCCPVLHAKLVGFLLVGIVPIYSYRNFAGSVPIFGLAVCSVQFSVHPPGHIVEIHTGIKGVLMFGGKNLARRTSRLATDILSVYSP